MAVAATLGANPLYQFWLHAPWLPKLGPLEWVFNTPTHHKVPHGSVPEYLACNHGGVLIVFDRLFGTFVDLRDDVTTRYGLTTPLFSHNPLWIAVHGRVAFARELRAVRGVMPRLRVSVRAARGVAIATLRAGLRGAEAAQRNIPPDTSIR